MNKLLPIVLIMSLTSACQKDNGPCVTCPPPYVPRLVLSTIELAASEIYLTLASTDTSVLQDVKVMRDSVMIDSSGRINTRKVTLRDIRLLPSHTYRYKAYRLSGSMPVDSSAQLVVTTMDTTSNNFTWQMYTLGGIGSIIWDVAIVNDTSVIAVGEIYQNDSATLYNAARWNGSNWSVFRIPYYYNGQPFYSSIGALYVVSDSDIWFGIGNLIHWNGQTYEPIEFSPTVWGSHLVRRLWGRGKTLYVVGDSGSIAFYDGTSWQKLTSGTTLDIQDIWGSVNSKTGQLEVIAVASLPYSSYDRKILSIRGTTVTPLSDDYISTSVTGAWFLPGKKYFVSGDGVYTKQDPYDTTFIWLPDPATYASTHYERAIRGIDLNDIAIAGDAGEILHFNGIRWQSYRSMTHLDYGNFHSVAFKGNMIVAVGDNFDAAVVAIGRR
ncbi:MAG: hypothetical protein ABSF91_11325 [Bacteroidota bacterium]